MSPPNFSVRPKVWTKVLFVSANTMSIDLYLTRISCPLNMHCPNCKTTRSHVWRSHLKLISYYVAWVWSGFSWVWFGLVTWFGLNQSNIFFLSEPDWVLNIKSGQRELWLKSLNRPAAATRNLSNAFSIHKQIKNDRRNSGGTLRQNKKKQKE